MRRIAVLTVRFAWSAKLKLSLLVLLVAVGMTVFLLVSELSRVSTTGLDQAISKDAGQTGTYRVDVRSTVGLSPEHLSRTVSGALTRFAHQPVQVVEVLPPLASDCPPYDVLGTPDFLVLRTPGYRPAAMPFGTDLPAGTAFCFGGQVVPASAAYVPDKQQQSRWGTGLFIRADYEPVAALATTAPITYRFIVVTGREDDQGDLLQRTVERSLRPAASRQALSTAGLVDVLRVDTSDSIRAASRGIATVYGVIGWGTLVLGGLGLLVSELIVVRGRTWFFGLARAVGARPWHIAALVVGDVVLVLLAGTMLAALGAVALQPLAESFAQSAFGISIHLLHPAVIPRLIAGGLLLLLLASAYPAWTAIRQDPLDVLEPKS